jgi:hypothetical protein
MAKRAPKDQISDYDWEHLTKLTQDSLVKLVVLVLNVKSLVISMCGDCADSAQAVVTVFFFIA